MAANHNILKEIFLKILKPILAFDELLFYLSYIRLIKNEADRAIVYNIVKNLEIYEKDISKSFYLCNEFKLNSPTLLIDWKVALFTGINTDYNKYKSLFIGS